MALNRVWQTPVETSFFGAFDFTKTGNNSLLPLLDNEKASAHPDQNRHKSNQASADSCAFHVGLEGTWATAITTAVITARVVDRPAACVFVAAKQAVQLAVEVAPQLIQIRWPLVGAFWPGTLLGRRRWGFRLGIGLGIFC